MSDTISIGQLEEATAKVANQLKSVGEEQSSLLKMNALSNNSNAEIARQLVKLPPEQWIETLVGMGVEGMTEELKETISKAVEDRRDEQLLVVAALKRVEDMDMDPEHRIFTLFREKRVAEVLKEHPKLLGVLKTRAKAGAGKVSKELVEIYETIAKDPDAVIKYSKYLEDRNDIMEDPKWPSLSEHWRVMGYYVDEQNDMICNMHPEYRTVPKTSIAEDIQQANKKKKKKKKKKKTSEGAESKKEAVMKRIAELEKM